MSYYWRAGPEGPPCRSARGDSLLEDEFDLDEDGDAVLGVSEPEGAMMSDDVMS